LRVKMFSLSQKDTNNKSIVTTFWLKHKRSKNKDLGFQIYILNLYLLLVFSLCIF
jgi:hypothetical protein